jgi:hypothetical protein
MPASEGRVIERSVSQHVSPSKVSYSTDITEIWQREFKRNVEEQTTLN